MKFHILKKMVFSLYGFGILLDHITTNIGLNVFKIEESNIITFFLIENGLWMYVDLILFIFVILLLRFFSDKLTARSNMVVLIFPFLSGLIRMIAGIWNMVILYYL